MSMEPTEIWPAPRQQDAEARASTASTNPILLRRAGLAVLAYVLFCGLVPLIPISTVHISLWVAASLIIVPTMVFMLLQLWLSYCLVSLQPSARTSASATLGFVFLWACLMVLVSHLSRAESAHIAVRLLTGVLFGLIVTAACTYFGMLVSRIIREPNVLLPVALLAMPVDYIGAMTKIGFTNNVVATHPGIVSKVSVPVPEIGNVHPVAHALALIGPGDALFMAFFFAIVLRLGMNARGTFWWMYGLLTLAMVFVLQPNGFNIAALVPMGLAIIIANFRFFKFTREEFFAMVYAGGLMLVVVVFFYFYSHTHFFHNK